MRTNLVSNPELTPQTIVSYPDITLGRGAAVSGSRVVFDGSGNAPFVIFGLSEGLVNGHTYSVEFIVDEGLVGNLHVSTSAGPDSQSLGTVTEASTASFTFAAAGSEGGFQIIGDLHGSVASIGEPLLAE